MSFSYFLIRRTWRLAQPSTAQRERDSTNGGGGVNGHHVEGKGMKENESTLGQGVETKVALKCTASFLFRFIPLAAPLMHAAFCDELFLRRQSTVRSGWRRTSNAFFQLMQSILHVFQAPY